MANSKEYCPKGYSQGYATYDSSEKMIEQIDKNLNEIKIEEKQGTGSNNTVPPIHQNMNLPYTTKTIQTNIVNKTNEIKNIQKNNNAKNPTELNINKIIEKLLSVLNNKPGTLIDLKEEEIKYIIDKSLYIIKKEPVLVKLEAPLKICGDIHGQYYDLLRIFVHTGYPDKHNYLFLGNYVDFGKQGIEVICLLLCYKIKYPEKMTLLRGNHESSIENRVYGFYDECKRRYNVFIWKSFVELFNYLPIAALINDVIFCVHGGLCPELKSPSDILSISRPTEIPDCGLLCHLLNSNPDMETLEFDEDQTVEDNSRNAILFGIKIVEDFVKNNNLDLIVRGNQVVDDGYEFFGNRKLITIFSAPNFKGEFDNSSGILIIDENLSCQLKVLRPVENLKY